MDPFWFLTIILVFSLLALWALLGSPRKPSRQFGELPRFIPPAARGLGVSTEQLAANLDRVSGGALIPLPHGAAHLPIAYSVSGGPATCDYCGTPIAEPSNCKNCGAPRR